MYAVVASSPKALARKAKIHEGKPIKESAIYPFATMETGQSFAVPFADVDEMVLRNAVSRRNRRVDEVFVVVKHKDIQMYEVARIE